MNAEQATSYLQALLASVTIGVIIPIVILLLMLVVIGYTLLRAQRRADFNIAMIFCDENGKASAARFLMIMSFVYSCYYLTARLIGGKPDPTEFYAFLMAFANSITFVTLAQKWDGRLPFTKGPDQGN